MNIENPKLSPSEIHLDVNQDGQSAADLLSAETGFSKQRIKQIMQQGAVWLTNRFGTQRLRRHKKLLSKGDQIHLYYDEKVLQAQVEAPTLIADEGAYSVWYKPYGMWSQGSKWGDHTALYRWVEGNHQPQRSAFLVHRLDRAATGLILVAHQKRAAAALSKLFESRALSKRYQVIVHGNFAEAGDAPIRIDVELDGKPACTYATMNRYSNARNCSLLDIEIETGRKHQIRRHLASIGFPVVGDRLYGVAGGNMGDNKAEQGEPDLQLTACSLSFTCPLSGSEKVFQLPGELLPKL